MLSVEANPIKFGETFKLTEPPLETPQKGINAFADDMLNCSLCHGRFKNPKSLTCLHSFCQTCLDVYIAKLPDSYNRFFPCPVCRELHPLPKTGITTAHWVTSSMPALSLPPMSSRRSSITPMTDREKTDRTDRLQLQVVRTDKRCDVCQENDEQSVAMFWCPTCRESLCDLCTKSHRGMRITRSHALMDIDDVKEKQFKMIQSHEMCPDHRGKVLDLYCQDHQCAVCSTCVALSHRRCDTILAVDKMAKTMRSKRTNKTLAQRFRNCITALETIISHKDSHRQRFLNKKESILDEISKLKLAVIQILDDAEEKMKDEMDTICRDYEDILQEKIDRSAGLKDTIQSALDTLEHTMATGSDYQQVITTQTMSDECDRYESMVDEDRLDYKEVDLIFSADENLVRLSKLVDRMGCIEVAERKNLTKNFKSCAAQKERIINGKIKGDRNNSIFNSVDVSETGEIILSDFNNFAVKLFDQHGMFRSSTKLNSPPRGVASLPDKVIAVALPEECVIKLMSTEGKFLSQMRELHTSFKAYRICNYRGKIMGICYSKACRSLSIVERNGRVERTITRKRDYKGLGGVAYDPIRNQMYMSDRDAVTCFNAHGKQVFRNTYRRTDLRGMTIDCQGNIYVCSHDSGQVLQISPDGVLIKSILVPMSPQDVAIEPMGTKMIVVGLGDIIHIYNLV